MDISPTFLDSHVHSRVRMRVAWWTGPRREHGSQDSMNKLTFMWEVVIRAVVHTRRPNIVVYAG